MNQVTCFKCPVCQQEIKADASKVGEFIDCPICEQVIEIPADGTLKVGEVNRAPKRKVASRQLKTLATPQKMICPECKGQVPEGATKCKHCGSKIGLAGTVDKVSKGLMGCGCIMTILFTVPILIFLLFAGGC